MNLKTCRHCDISFHRDDTAPIPHDRCGRCHEEMEALTDPVPTPTPNADRPDSGTTGTCNPTTGKTRGFEPHPELVKLANGGVSDGSTASYYRLPEGAEQLQDLISYRNMNGQIAEIFRSCYRYGRASHSDQLRDAKKIAFYAQAEVERLEKYGCED